MIILSVLTLVFAVTLARVIRNRRDRFFDTPVAGSFTLMSLSGLGLVVALLAFPYCRIQVDAAIRDMEPVRYTVNQAIDQGLYVPASLGMMQDVFAVNRALAPWAYYNDGLLDLWIPDRIEEVETVNPFRKTASH